MAKLKFDLSKALSTAVKTGLPLLLVSKGMPKESADLITGLSDGLLSSFSIEKAPDMLRDFQKLVKDSIRNTLAPHEFVFDEEQIDIISDAILSEDKLQSYMGDDAVTLLRSHFINALDEIGYPYKQHGLNVDEILESILQKIQQGIQDDSNNLTNLDTNVNVHLLIDKVNQFSPDKTSTEKLPHYLTEVEPFRPASVLHREKEISELIGKIRSGQKMIMISGGVGGVGKTALARAVFTALEPDFKHVAWLNFTGDLASSLHSLRIFEAIPDPADRLIQIKQFLNITTEPTLLVLDNVNDVPARADLNTLNAFSPCVQVLMTSRLPGITGVDVYPIEFLSPEQCADIFYLHYFRDSAREHTKIVTKMVVSVSRHTLTVELLAKGAQWASGDLPAVWERLQEAGFTFSELMIETQHTPDQHTILEHIQALFTMLDLDEAKRKIMRVFSILPPSTTIPMEFRDWLPCGINDLKWLVDRGWLQQPGSGFSIHQMVQQSVRLQEPATLEDCQGLISTFSRSAYIPSSTIYTQVQERLLLPISLIDWFDPAPEDAVFAGLLHTTAYFLTQNLSDYPTALEYYQKALEIVEKVLGKDHPDTAITYDNMAGVYRAQGDTPTALVYYQKALEIREKVLGKDHPSTASTYNNMAGVYQDQGDYPTALVYYQKDLKISEKVLGKAHPSTATTYNNMAGVYQAQGDYPTALKYFMKSYLVFLKLLGSGHPSTKIIKRNLETAYLESGVSSEPFDVWLQHQIDLPD